MKRVLLSFFSLFLSVGIAMADDRPITFGQLPMPAQEFLKEYFPNVEVMLVTQDDDLLYKDYGVTLKNGTSIDFDSNGHWQEVRVSSGMVPIKIIPKGIADYVARNYAEEQVVSVERDRKTVEVKLSNGLELTFDKQSRLIDIDD